MNSYERMITLLKGLKLYRLNGEGLIEAETYAYGKVLSQLEERVYALGKDLFWDETESERSAEYEKLFGFPKTAFPLEEANRAEREDKIRCMKLRMSLSPDAFSLEQVKKYGESAGITFTVTEDFNNSKIKIAVTENKGYYQKNDLIRFLTDAFPAGSILEIMGI